MPSGASLPGVSSFRHLLQTNASPPDRYCVRLVLIALLLAIGIGFATGGRLFGLSALRFRLRPFALAGVALQFLSPSKGGWPYLLLMISFVLLTVFAIVNIRVRGFPLIMAGTLLNFLVIGVNHGMPVTEHALSASGQKDTLTELVRSGGEKHHLASPSDRLLFLGDMTPIPPPVKQAVSAGDIVAYAGMAFVVVAAMRRQRPPPVRDDAQMEAASAV
jgi:hypothetical protein